jgi:hypothetical protein
LYWAEPSDPVADGAFKEETMKRTHSMMSLLAAGALICAAPLALAQSSTDAQSMQHPKSGALTHQGSLQEYPQQSATETGTSQQSSTGSMSSTSMSNGQLLGEHSMSGTVTSVNSSGMVRVNSEGMELRLHFPNAAQHLKKGDKITVHLGYTKDSSASSGS